MLTLAGPKVLVALNVILAKEAGNVVEQLDFRSDPVLIPGSKSLSNYYKADLQQPGVQTVELTHNSSLSCKDIGRKDGDSGAPRIFDSCHAVHDPKARSVGFDNDRCILAPFERAVSFK
jgi:hypothetical protein